MGRKRKRGTKKKRLYGPSYKDSKYNGNVIELGCSEMPLVVVICGIEDYHITSISLTILIATPCGE